MTPEEAIKQLINHAQWKLNGDDLTALEMAIEALKDSRPTGEWIREKNGTYTCNFCGANIWGYWLEHIEANYCPSCGAKMVEPQGREK